MTLLFREYGFVSKSDSLSYALSSICVLQKSEFSTKNKNKLSELVSISSTCLQPTTKRSSGKRRISRTKEILSIALFVTFFPRVKEK